MIYLSCYFSDNDFILWIELVFQSFKGNKDSSKRVVLVWKTEKLNYSSFTWWELCVIEWDTICKKAIKEVSHGNTRKGDYPYMFLNKNSSFRLISFLLAVYKEMKWYKHLLIDKKTYKGLAKGL